MIRTQGTLKVKKISSRNGPFAVADLVTEVAEFKVKDSILDQFEEGEYQGTFFISEIYLAPYVSFGRCVTELRARLHDVRVDTERDLPPETGAADELDPLDESPAPRVASRAASQRKSDAPKAAAKRAESAPSSKPSKATTTRQDEVGASEEGEDLELFGDDIHTLIQEGAEIKLDPTIDDRARFRQQTARLRALGYRFDSKQQTWSRG